MKSSRHYFPLIESKRLWSKNGYSTKSQPTSRHGYRSECTTKGVLQSSCEIVGQPKLDPKTDDLAGIVRGGLSHDWRWRHYWREGLCRTRVGEKNHGGNVSPHSIPVSASENILLRSFPQIIQFSNRGVVYTRPSKLCEFCIKSCAERRKMTAVNWVNKADFPKISPRFLQDFPKISTRFPQDFPKISPRFLQDFPKIS